MEHSTDRIQDNPEGKDPVSLNRPVTPFSFMLCSHLYRQPSAQSAPGLDASRQATGAFQDRKGVVLLS